jgi:hypothetical protein
MCQTTSIDPASFGWSEREEEFEHNLLFFMKYQYRWSDSA